MHLTKLFLHNFRLYERTEFNFSKGLNFIYGRNAIGKTSILEAIHYLITGKSFRSPQVSDLIKKNTLGFVIEATYKKNEIEQKIKIISGPNEKKIQVNSTTYQSMTSLYGLLKGVIVSPDDVAMIKGAPSLRRGYLDMQLVQADPLYVHHLMRYHRAMRQRNALLKKKNIEGIEIWEGEMALSAAYITLNRYHLVLDLDPLSKRVYAVLSDEPVSMDLSYHTSAPVDQPLTIISDYFRDTFCKMRRRELHLGNTLYGPHRDDLLVSLGGLDTRYYSSEGQQRSALIALRFAEWERLKVQTSEAPIMLLDDIAICLDEQRRHRLFSFLDFFDQIFLTATSELKGVALSKQAQTLHLTGGPATP